MKKIEVKVDEATRIRNIVEMIDAFHLNTEKSVQERILHMALLLKDAKIDVTQEEIFCVIEELIKYGIRAEKSSKS